MKKPKKPAAKPKPPRSTAPRRRLVNVRIGSIDLVSADGTQLVPVWERRYRRGRPATIPARLRADVAAYPGDSKNKRAKRLGISRRTAARLMGPGRFQARGPIVLHKLLK